MFFPSMHGYEWVSGILGQHSRQWEICFVLSDFSSLLKTACFAKMSLSELAKYCSVANSEYCQILKLVILANFWRASDLESNVIIFSFSSQKEKFARIYCNLHWLQSMNIQWHFTKQNCKASFNQHKSYTASKINY